MTATTSRTAFRSMATLAGRILPVHHPVSAFIAVNPLGGFEDRPFARAVADAGSWYGTAGTLPESRFRAAHAAGRITADDVREALNTVLPDLPVRDALLLGGRSVPVIAVLAADLTHAPAPAGRSRRATTRSEVRAPAVAETIDAAMSKWCAAFTGDQPGWPMPGRDRGFYAAWRELAVRDTSLPRAARAGLRSLPETADAAAWSSLSRLDVAADDHLDYLRAHLTRQPGWAAYARWCGERPVGARTGFDLVELLAVRLSYEAVLLDAAGTRGPQPPQPPPAPPAPSARQRAALVAAALGVTAADHELDAVATVLAAVPAERRLLIWQEAYELHYRRALLRDLTTNDPATKDPADPPPDAQVVCCIDVRSEGLRRHLESLGAYETYGFAGFFAVAMRFRDLAGGAPSDLCPALVEPGLRVAEVPAAGAAGPAGRHVRGLGGLARGEDAFHAAKDATVSPFVLAESAGWAAGPLAVIKTALPGTAAALRRRLRRAIAPDAPTELDVNRVVPPAERLLYAHAALTTMGLTRFARLVVLCAHGSSTENNPYQASLDCGACGGHRGGPNARALAAVLNDPAVRDQLAGRGIRIPAETWFAAAEHDTSTDRVRVLDRHQVPASHRGVVARLHADLDRAGAALTAQRCADLPAAPRRPAARRARTHVARRAADWAQVYPEWGLAGNAAFIVGPRRLTAGLDLGRRAFLHSYDATVDPDGAALETILTAPLVVAQWINCQYYFSAVAPQVFGAGTKTVHNAVGGLGVLSGHTGDLRLGLPWQSVAVGNRLVHEPMRLLAVVEAPLARIDAVVDRNPVLQRLFGHDWVALTAREHPGQPWQRWTRESWKAGDPAPVPAAVKE
ncbi:DUF2309 domain-containing protein [Amorphoplanes nipponensis]|uniref:Probable inorganic carbon transporter subunit DabA n=1 Tax=Actinoplanes nipponensis TaxID=135950 RepID=A0A919MRY9_9ACTN|nr:DUF2309 domain-containing protein [Actinoplanes nipponensis]GIE47450.1 UPF0753 protein [Actinoplanes nipponensis]